MEPAALALVLTAVLTSTLDVRAIAGADGEIWLGTTGGLVRIAEDGTALHGVDGGLPDGTVRALALDGPQLWVGTDRGLVSIDRSTLRAGRTIDAGAPITALAIDGSSLLVGTLRGLSRWSEGSLTTIAGAPAQITDVVAIGALVYVTTQRDGTWTWNGAAWHRVPGDRMAWDLEPDGDGVLVATSGGLVRLRDGRPVRTAASRAVRALPVRDLRAVRREGSSIVVGTCGAGAFRISARGVAVPIGSRDRCVRALGSSARGVLVASAAGLEDAEGAALLQPGLPDPDVSSLARTDEGLWVGTFRAGLALVRGDGSISRYGESSGLVDERINRLAVDGDGDLWIATDRGLVERVGGRWEVRGLLDRHVLFVAWTGDAIVAAGGDDAYRWDGSTLVPLGVGRRAQDVARTAGGSLAIATAEGLSIGEGDARRTIVAGAGALADDWTTAVALHDGALAIGTYNAGVALLDEHGAIRTIHRELWVNAGALASVELGGARVLAAGTLDDGLWIWDGAAWSRFGARDGLPDDDVTAIVPDGTGGLWVATRGGVARITAARSVSPARAL